MARSESAMSCCAMMTLGCLLENVSEETTNVSHLLGNLDLWIQMLVNVEVNLVSNC